jgi:hypothetical protein
MTKLQAEIKNVVVVLKGLRLHLKSTLKSLRSEEMQFVIESAYRLGMEEGISFAKMHAINHPKVWKAAMKKGSF